MTGEYDSEETGTEESGSDSSDDDDDMPALVDMESDASTATADQSEQKPLTKKQN